MQRMYGRRTVIKDLLEPLLAGQTVLLYGPVGGGKSTLLQALAGALKKQRRPCGLCRQTHSLSHATDALMAAYPGVRRQGRTRRQMRSDLSQAIEARPGALLLDHPQHVGTQFKGYLRTLRGTGLGVLWTADCETPRDHEQLRAMHLAYLEIEAPPLSSRCLHHILDDCLAVRPLPCTLSKDDRSAIVRMARGRPGWIIMLSDLLNSNAFWSKGRVLKGPLRAAVLSRIAGMYFANTDGLAAVEVPREPVSKAGMVGCNTF